VVLSVVIFLPVVAALASAHGWRPASVTVSLAALAVVPLLAVALAASSLCDTGSALLREAAARVGVLDEIERLPEGWETPLAREFKGVDLSGGQWQRVALARAIMAQLGHDADVLILDEPTASLDVRLEHELYEHFAELARGRTTLLVSHRFSTVRMAQRIVFLEAGRVAEDGTHSELVARAGRYAELYRLQAEHYVATGALE
jgi:ATP-binding cassette subfamily B protein